MAPEIIGIQKYWELTRDSEGHRTYKVIHRVRADKEDGPANVMQTPGLPLPGAWWVFSNDIDLWAWCKFDANVKPQVEEEPYRFWLVEQTFSTKPPDKEKQRCQDASIEDPLLEPQKISGSTQKDKFEATHDRFGPILNSAFEPIRGPQVEFDADKAQVVIEQNVPYLQHDLCTSLMNHVNDDVLWGYPARCVKLSDFKWERKYYGQCYKYYTRTFTFDCATRADPDTGETISAHDRDALDEGTKVLNGHWTTAGAWSLDNIGGIAPDPENPTHYKRAVDRAGNVCRIILNGSGLPAEAKIGTGSGTVSYDAGRLRIEYYEEADFLQLGIPTDLEV